MIVSNQTSNGIYSIEKLLSVTICYFPLLKHARILTSGQVHSDKFWQCTQSAGMCKHNQILSNETCLLVGTIYKMLVF